MDERFHYCGRWLPWQHQLSSKWLIFTVITSSVLVNLVDSIYYPGQGYSVSQSGGGVDTGWNPGQGQPTSAVPTSSSPSKGPYDVTAFTHGGGNKQGANEGPTKTAASKLLNGDGGSATTSFHSFIQQSPSAVPAVTNNIISNSHQQQAQPQPQQQSSAAASQVNLLFLLQALRSRVKNIIPPTPAPTYYTNSHQSFTNYLQPQPSPMQYDNHYNHHQQQHTYNNNNNYNKYMIPQQPPTILPTQPSALQVYQPQSVFLQAPVPPNRPLPPVPPPNFHQQYHHQQQPQQQYHQQQPPQYMPPPMQPQQRPPPLMQQRPPPQSQAPQPARRPQPRPARPSYYNAYTYPMSGGECSGFAPAGQLCCDGIRNILPKGTHRQFICCSKTYFDPTTQVCCGDHPVPKPAHKGPPLRCCGHMLYDPTSHLCCDKFPMPNPGGLLKCCTKSLTYNPANQMCCGESVKPRLPSNKGQDCCGKHMYNPATHLCCNEGNTFLKGPGMRCCGKNTYQPSVQMCCFGDAVPKGRFCSAK